MDISESQWCKAALPIRHGGVGIRRCRKMGVERSYPWLVAVRDYSLASFVLMMTIPR